jgi:DNA-binding NarL/FixJ family response regulator
MVQKGKPCPTCGHIAHQHRPDVTAEEIAVLRDLAGLSWGRIAAQTGLSKSGVYTKYARWLKRGQAIDQAQEDSPPGKTGRI